MKSPILLFLEIVFQSISQKLASILHLVKKILSTRGFTIKFWHASGSKALTVLFLFLSHLAIAQHTEHFRPDADPADIELRTLLFQTDPNKAPIERTVQVIDGYVIIEGDIVLGLEKDLFGSARGAVITNSGTNRWPNGVIPYEIEAGYPDVDMINYAINHLINNSNICMVPHTNEANYVKFINAQGCSSFVGMVGGEQTINLSPNCGVSSTVHEVLHAAGFWHEQSRADRNTYVTINVANIEPANAFNFDQYNDGMDIGAYDYGSIMHYGPFAFTSNGMPTITINIPPGTPSSNIGQRVGLSAGDVTAINTLYPIDNGCGTVNVPANLTIRSLGTLAINGSVVTVTNCIIENDGSVAIGASTANFFYGLQGNANVTFFGAAQNIPALNPGQTQPIGITNDFAALANGTYYFGVWVNSNQNPTEGHYGDNSPSWNAPLLTLPVVACTADVTVSTATTMGNTVAGNSITTQNMVSVNGAAVFSSPNVNLNVGFEVPMGNCFEANNVGCGYNGVLMCMGGPANGTCASPHVITCGQAFQGNNTGGASNWSSYQGGTFVGLTGPEKIHTLVIPGATTRTITLSGYNADLDLVVGTACDPETVFDGSASEDPTEVVVVANNTANPVTYYIIVDGYLGAVSAYTLSCN